MKTLTTIILLLFSAFTFAQTWNDVGGGTNNSSHGMLTWNNQLINLGSFNAPCNRVASWDGTSWSCLGGGVGIVARAGTVWDGKLVVVGDFWNVQQPCVGCNGVAVWDGVSWSPLGNGVNNDVLSCTVWNNELVIAGDFNEADGVAVSRIVKWNGTQWESVGPIGSFDNDIRAMVEFEGELWVGGDFNNVGGNPPNDGLVKYDPTTNDWLGGNSGVDLVGGVNETVRVLYVNPNDGNLYMGGEFPELWDGDAAAEDFNMSGIAMYDGSNWTPLGTGLNEYCRAMHEYNGDIVAGGYFTTAGGVPANKIAKWDGTTWTAMGLGFDGIGIDEYVKSAAVWDGIFFAGGAYTQAEGGPMNYIAQWYEAPTAPPVAWMTSSSTNLCGSGCIDFLDNSTNAPTSWNWSFPGADITSSTAQDPGPICWASPGTYTVTLQACNSFGCNTQSVDITVDNGATVTVNDATICGGGPATITATPSVSGGTFLWSPGGETTASISVNPASTTTYTVTYSYLGCNSSATSTVTVGTGPAVSVASSGTICAGQSTTITATPATGGGTYLWTPGGETTASITVSPAVTTDYTVEYTLSGCASTPVVETITVNPTYALSEAVTACENSMVTYPDGSTATITGNTTYVSNMTSAAGCDSVITTNVTMDAGYTLTENVSVCDGSNYIYPDGFSETITANTSYVSNLTTVAGCDSIITTNVQVVSAYSGTENVSVCIGTVYMYPDGFSETIAGNGSYTSNLVGAAGCDSIIQTNITAVSSYNTTESAQACQNTSFTYPDGFVETIVANTSHTSNLTSVAGCDSIVVTNVTMNSPYNLSENVSACNGDVYTYPDGSTATITASTSYTSNLTTVAGCDSVILTNVTMSPDYSLSESVNVCSGNVHTYPDGSTATITGNTSYTSSLTSVAGCDSIIVTNVTMTPIYNETINLDVCSGSTFVYPDGTSSTNITANESNTSVLSSVDGCDSTIVTNLTVATVLNYTNDIALCSGENYTYPDGTVSTNITANETQVSNLVSANGCDSIITTNITVNALPSVTVNSETICAGEDITITATPSAAGGSYLWSPGNETTGSITVTPGVATSYSVVYTLNGCSSNAANSTITVNPMPDNSVTDLDNVITATETLSTYQWIDCNDNDALISGETGQSYTPIANGSYAVILDLNGCLDTSACTVISTIGIAEVNGVQLTIYPNPVGETLHVSANVAIDGISYEIVDAQGRIVRSSALDNSGTIDVTKITEGAYTLRFTDAGTQVKFVKQ